MAKNYDRGLGRSMRMHDKLIDRAMRTMWRLPEESTTEAPVTKPAWTPGRWANRINRAVGK